MKILVDSFEYRCWHEVGHAVVCLHLGGDVEFIEFLEGDARGHARTRCIVTPEIEREVACGGFAAEFYLLNERLAEQRQDDSRNISQVVFHNATNDREDYWGRKLGPDDYFSKEEDERFMNHAIALSVPIFNQYLSGMRALVRELVEKRKVAGARVRELLRPDALT